MFEEDASETRMMGSTVTAMLATEQALASHCITCLISSEETEWPRDPFKPFQSALGVVYVSRRDGGLGLIEADKARLTVVGLQYCEEHAPDAIQSLEGSDDGYGPSICW